ncbi:hypothetical protein D3C79_760540 [compost metagenome]
MTWTYGGNPKDNPIDRVRFTVGDTDENSPLLTDEEIQYLLDQHNGNPQLAAIASVKSIIAKLARLVDYTIGPESVKNSQKLLNYRRLLSTLEADLNSAAAPIWTGPSGKTKTQPIFDVGMHDNRREGGWGLTDGQRD